MNKIFIVGNLTAAPEMRSTRTGDNVCSFNVAVDRRFDVREKKTDFFRVSAWRGLGENCHKYLDKGKKVAVVGELHANTYQDPNGNMRYSLDVKADDIEFLTPKSASAPAPEQKPADEFMSGFETLQNDDIPF